MLIVLNRFLNCFKEMSIFSYSLLPKILKLRRSSLRLLFLIKIVYKQFLLLKNWRGSYDLFSLIWNLLYLISPQAKIFQLERIQLKFYKVWNKKGSVKKRKTRINRSRVLKIALEGGREWKGGGNGSFPWESFDYSMLLLC